MKVGDTFRVFEVSKPKGDILHLKDKTGIELHYQKLTKEHLLNLAPYYLLQSELKQVGTIRIKSLKL